MITMIEYAEQSSQAAIPEHGASNHEERVYGLRYNEF
jgi:hypothetical protein